VSDLRDRIPTAILLCAWLAILLVLPIGLIASYVEANPTFINRIGFGILLGLTMLFYWATGVMTAMIKKWKLE
jgi:hypothetical protein